MAGSVDKRQDRFLHPFVVMVIFEKEGIAVIDNIREYGTVPDQIRLFRFQQVIIFRWNILQGIFYIIRKDFAVKFSGQYYIACTVTFLTLRSPLTPVNMPSSFFVHDDGTLISIS